MAIRELGPQPVVLVDLVMNWNSDGSEPLQVVRMRGDGFDPRELVGDPGSVAQAYRVWLEQLIELTGAVPLPDPESARGRPMRVFDEVAAYQDEVLQTGA